MDKCKINTVWAFEEDNDKTKDRSVCNSFFVPREVRGLASHLQSVELVTGEMVWLLYIQQPLSKATCSL